MELSARSGSKYKDALFTFIFEHKEFALSLYNALNHSHYTNVDDLQIVTLKQVLYIKVRNDVAFLFHNEIYLTEQQSTWNPNIPYRILEYVVGEYERYVDDHHYNRYSMTMFKLPAPHFIVFYNGLEETVAESTLRLSDMFIDEEEGDLELIVRVYNINSPYNTELKRECKPLSEYCWLVERIRSDMEAEEDKRDSQVLGRVITKALEDMPDNLLIKEMLMRERNEVIGMIFEEYDEALYRKAAEDYAKEQNELGKRENAMETAEILLKEEPDWSDERIASIARSITSKDVARIRKGMKLV